MFIINSPSDSYQKGKQAELKATNSTSLESTDPEEKQSRGRNRRKESTAIKRQKLQKQRVVSSSDDNQEYSESLDSDFEAPHDNLFYLHGTMLKYL